MLPLWFLGLPVRERMQSNHAGKATAGLPPNTGVVWLPGSIKMTTPFHFTASLAPSPSAFFYRML